MLCLVTRWTTTGCNKRDLTMKSLVQIVTGTWIFLVKIFILKKWDDWDDWDDDPITSVLCIGRKELENWGESQEPNRVSCCKAEPQMKKTFRYGKIHNTNWLMTHADRSHYMKNYNMLRI